ncbi:hypothetical protein QF046_000540 [Microbacterium sp. W4I4]|uniref:peptidylprolyl isomerase n=1 Tax=Microbacterium sp. W4I4 TaxID=3042295 RepID=UPI0027880519|nr:peptidylprolyl isomerase [Microbacterium sp. W4I4]MDQ0612899.1 hypothetical protein [Microbacterium sp. W4I4]
MRKTTAALSALALSALVLTGCSAASGSNAAGCVRDDSAALQMAVKATGDIGAPKVSLTSPVPTSHVIYDDLIVGDGPAVRESGQDVVGAMTLLSGTTGQVLQSGAVIWSPKKMDELLGGGGAALTCATQGSRVAFAIPAADLPEGMAEQAGLDAQGSLVGSIDIQEVLLPKAEGRDVFNDARGLPTVVRAADGQPGIIIPDTSAPKKAVTQTLIAGHGAKVDDGTAMFNYTAVAWADRTVTGSSWGSGVVYDATTLPKPVMEEVAKATVGSQLLVVVPGEKGAATAYVVDVLGIVPPELAQG